ncbi:MAG: hypothetical protein L0Y71_04400 [Gemmataceae bacterium]|nr:hypothetical protein [Gemmataceae bacterium]
MRDPQVWSVTAEDGIHVVVFKDGVFYAGMIPAGEYSKFPKEIEDEEDVEALLGKDCPRAGLDEITRVVARNTGDLILESGDEELLKAPMKQEGIKVLEAIQDEKGRGWEVDVQSKMRLGSALIAVVVAIVMGGGMVWVYFGVVSGRIRRIHWLFAWLINTFGPIVLLITAVLIVIGAMAAFGYYLTHPAETWTLEEER